MAFCFHSRKQPREQGKSPAPIAGSDKSRDRVLPPQQEVPKAQGEALAPQQEVLPPIIHV